MTFLDLLLWAQQPGLPKGFPQPGKMPAPGGMPPGGMPPGAQAGMMIFLVIYFIFIFVVLALVFAGMWKAFTKAGQPGWAAIVPLYNFYVVGEISGRGGMFGLLTAIAQAVCFPVGLIMAIMLFIDFSKAYGQGPGFGVGLALLGPIFFPILGFGMPSMSARPAEAAANPAVAATMTTTRRKRTVRVPNAAGTRTRMTARAAGRAMTEVPPGASLRGCGSGRGRRGQGPTPLPSYSVIGQLALLRRVSRSRFPGDTKRGMGPARCSRRLLALGAGFLLFAPIPPTDAWPTSMPSKAFACAGGLEIMATTIWATESPSSSARLKGPRLASSRVTFPHQPAWMVGAVKWMTRPVRARVLLPLIKQM